LERVADELTGDTSTSVTYEDAVEATVQARNAIRALEKAEAHGLEFEYETFYPSEQPVDSTETMYQFQFKLMPCFEFDTHSEMIQAREEIEAVFPDFWKE
jgi:hypothetical protein